MATVQTATLELIDKSTPQIKKINKELTLLSRTLTKLGGRTVNIRFPVAFTNGVRRANTQVNSLTRSIERLNSSSTMRPLTTSVNNLNAANTRAAASGARLRSIYATFPQNLGPIANVVAGFAAFEAVRRTWGAGFTATSDIQNAQTAALLRGYNPDVLMSAVRQGRVGGDALSVTDSAGMGIATEVRAVVGANLAALEAGTEAALTWADQMAASGVSQTRAAGRINTALKVLDISGVGTNTVRFKELGEGIATGLARGGENLNESTVLAAFRTSNLGSTLTQKGAQAFVAAIDEMGRFAGSAVARGIRELTASRGTGGVSGKRIDALANAGLRGQAAGSVVGGTMIYENPSAWSRKFLAPALDKMGVNLDDPVAVAAAMGQLFDTNSARFFTNEINNRDERQRAENMQLEKARIARSKNLGAQLANIAAQWKNTAARGLEPLAKALAPLGEKFADWLSRVSATGGFGSGLVSAVGLLGSAALLIKPGAVALALAATFHMNAARQLSAAAMMLGAAARGVPITSAAGYRGGIIQQRKRSLMNAPNGVVAGQRMYTDAVTQQVVGRTRAVALRQGGAFARLAIGMGMTDTKILSLLRTMTKFRKGLKLLLKPFKLIGRTVGGAGALAGITTFLGGGSASDSIADMATFGIGAKIGGLIGSALGPIGAVIGSVLGGFIANWAAGDMMRDMMSGLQPYLVATGKKISYGLGYAFGAVKTAFDGMSESLANGSALVDTAIENFYKNLEENPVVVQLLKLFTTIGTQINRLHTLFVEVPWLKVIDNMMEKITAAVDKIVEFFNFIGDQISRLVDSISVNPATLPGAPTADGGGVYPGTPGYTNVNPPLSNKPRFGTIFGGGGDDGVGGGQGLDDLLAEDRAARQSMMDTNTETQKVNSAQQAQTLVEDMRLAFEDGGRAVADAIRLALESGVAIDVYQPEPITANNNGSFIPGGR